jgi:hypothetical protein
MLLPKGPSHTEVTCASLGKSVAMEDGVSYCLEARWLGKLCFGKVEVAVMLR